MYIQTTYYPLQLFSTLMRGLSLDVWVTTPNPSRDLYNGPTVPKFIRDLAEHTPNGLKPTKFIDVSAVLADSPEGKAQIRVAVLNKHEEQDFTIPLHFGPGTTVAPEVTVREIWHEDLKATNGFDGQNVGTSTFEIHWTGSYTIKKHSFQVLVFSIAA